VRPRTRDLPQPGAARALHAAALHAYARLPRASGSPDGDVVTRQHASIPGALPCRRAPDGPQPGALRSAAQGEEPHAPGPAEDEPLPLGAVDHRRYRHDRDGAAIDRGVLHPPRELAHRGASDQHQTVPHPAVLASAVPHRSRRAMAAGVGRPPVRHGRRRLTRGLGPYVATGERRSSGFVDRESAVLRQFGKLAGVWSGGAGPVLSDRHGSFGRRPALRRTVVIPQVFARHGPFVASALLALLPRVRKDAD